MMKLKNTLLLAFCFFSFSLMAQTDVLVHADQMPYFEGCEKLKDGSDKKRKCSNETLVSFLAHNVDYPDSAKVAGVQGTVYVSFIIDEEGHVTKPSIIRDIGGGCGDAAIAVVEKMPKWQPGVHDGKNVKVKLNLPIQFYLKNGISTPVDTDNYKITWGTLTGDKITDLQLKTHLTKVIMVRDRYGDPVPFTDLTLIYKRKKVFNTATSNGVLNKKQKRIIKKAKPGGRFYVEVMVHDENKKMKIGKEFEIID